jgi:hypothetical protein
MRRRRVAVSVVEGRTRGVLRTPVGSRTTGSPSHVGNVWRPFGVEIVARR